MNGEKRRSLPAAASCKSPDKSRFRRALIKATNLRLLVFNVDPNVAQEGSFCHQLLVLLSRAAENLPPRVAGQSANSCRKGYPPGFRGTLTRPKEVKVARLGSKASPPYVARPWSSSSKAAPPEGVAKSGSCMATGDGLALAPQAAGLWAHHRHGRLASVSPRAS